MSTSPPAEWRRHLPVRPDSPRVSGGRTNRSRSANLSLTSEELALAEDAALRLEVNFSQLVATASSEMAHRLGFFWAPPTLGGWRPETFQPRRRIGVRPHKRGSSVNRLQWQLIESASTALGIKATELVAQSLLHAAAWTLEAHTSAQEEAFSRRKIIRLRLTAEEYRRLDMAAEYLGVNFSRLVSTAGQERANGLGLFFSFPSRPRQSLWPARLSRGPERKSPRNLTVSLNAIQVRLCANAAAFEQMSLPSWLVATSLRFVEQIEGRQGENVDASRAGLAPSAGSKGSAAGHRAAEDASKPLASTTALERTASTARGPCGHKRCLREAVAQCPSCGAPACERHQQPDAGTHSPAVCWFGYSRRTPTKATHTVKPPCSISNCQRPADSKGLCNRHYLEQRRAQRRMG
jgi:hypothetical protein